MYKINLLFIFKIYPVISVIYFFIKKENNNYLDNNNFYRDLLKPIKILI